LDPHYNLVLEIEASTLNEMVNASVVPAGIEYQHMLGQDHREVANLKKSAK